MLNTPGQVIKQLKAEFLKRITPFPESKTTPEDTKVFNFVVGCFNDAAADVLIAAYESPTTPIGGITNDAIKSRIEKAKKTREENKRKKAERKARQEAKRVEKERQAYEAELEEARLLTPEEVH